MYPFSFLSFYFASSLAMTSWYCWLLRIILWSYNCKSSFFLYYYAFFLVFSLISIPNSSRSASRPKKYYRSFFTLTFSSFGFYGSSNSLLSTLSFICLSMERMRVLLIGSWLELTRSTLSSSFMALWKILRAFKGRTFT